MTSQLTLKIAEKLFDLDQKQYAPYNQYSNEILYGKKNINWSDLENAVPSIKRAWIEKAEMIINYMKHQINSIHAEAKNNEWDIGFEAYRTEILKLFK